MQFNGSSEFCEEKQKNNLPSESKKGGKVIEPKLFVISPSIFAFGSSGVVDVNYDNSCNLSGFLFASEIPRVRIVSDHSTM